MSNNFDKALEEAHLLAPLRSGVGILAREFLLMVEEKQKQAELCKDIVVIRAAHVIEGEFIVELDCFDYDQYKSLPSAIEVQGKILGKTGWSSDLNYACYKEKVVLGKIIDFYV